MRSVINSVLIKKLLVRVHLLMGFLLLVSGESRASHSMGADITYQSIGNNRYVVTLTFYRDCAGIQAANNADRKSTRLNSSHT